MQSLPSDEVHAAFTLGVGDPRIDNSAILRFKKRMAAEFRQQLTIGAPTNQDEASLRRLSSQLKAGKLIVKLFLRHPLHAKLYLVHRNDPNTPTVGFLGSSNLTLPGLAKQGELNVDVLDHDACNKLQKWFNDRWKDYGCIDISKELAELIDESWARVELIPPYHIYLKIAYHLSHEAIAGLSEFRIPREFNGLFDFQKAAVQLAARHVTRRGGVLVGDVLGLGKTLVGTALAKILQEDCLLETLIICPKNLVKMWQEYVDNYRLYAKVLPISKVLWELPDLRRYRVVLIDESHNLRNRDAPGDGVLVWVSGKEAGIYALAEVTEPAQVLNQLPDRKYWADASRAVNKAQAMIRFTSKLLERPLLKTKLLQDPVLKNLLVIRAPNATNFKVTPEQWQRVRELLKE